MLTPKLEGSLLTISNFKTAFAGLQTLPNKATVKKAWPIIASALIWLLSSFAYYFLVEARSLENGYDDASVFFFFFYLFWSVVAVAVFRSTFLAFFEPQELIHNAIVIGAGLTVLSGYVIYGLPLLPEVSVEKAPPNPPEFMFASAWYYLPKCADVLLQQVIVAGLILHYKGQGISTFRLSLYLAVAFGAFHLLLTFDGFTSLYVGRFTFASTVFGFCLPYLYLHLRFGIAIAYLGHWTFYALDATITHIVLS